MADDHSGARAAVGVAGTHVFTGPAIMVIVADEMPPQCGRPGPTGLVDDPALTALATLVDGSGAAWVGRCPAVGSVSLDAEAVANHVDHAERTIWPVYHDLCRPADFHAYWWQGYRRVNTAIAEAVADSAAKGASVWIHDYRLQLVPGRLRILRPDLRIGFSLHTAFPPPDLFAHMPTRHELLKGLLGADTIGFQTAASAENFLRLADAERPNRGSSERLPMVGVFPTSVDTPTIRGLAALDTTAAAAAGIRRDLGSPSKIVLSLDSGDEASGTDRRLRAIGAFLHDGLIDPSEVVFVQIVSPRGSADQEAVHERISREVARINGQFAAVGRPCVHYVVESPDLARRVALYRCADVMMSTPLRDGVNVPALEFVAGCRPGSALVLSEFSGSASVLKQAYQINPYDEEQLKSGLLAALTASEDEHHQRMTPMRDYVADYDTAAWLRSFLAALRPMSHVAPRAMPLTARPRPTTPRSRRRPPHLPWWSQN